MTTNQLEVLAFLYYANEQGGLAQINAWDAYEELFPGELNSLPEEEIPVN